MSDQPLDIGMLGYGFMGRAHANAIARLPMFFDDAPPLTRHVLIGRTESTLTEAADRLGFDHTTTDWRSVIDEIDVLYNLGPNHVHAEPSIAALEADTPVFCEKPLAPTGEAADRMAATADRTSVPAGVAFNYRFVPAIQYAKALIEDGELGEIRHFRGRYLQDWLADPDAPWSWRNDMELAGSGALGDLGSHTVDLARYLVGDIESVSGQLRTFIDERPTEDGTDTKPVTVDDAYSAQVQFETGTLGTIEASRVADGHKNDHTIELSGSKGSLRFSLERLNELEILRDGHRGYETILLTDPDDPYLDHWWPPGHVLGWEHTFVHENYEFLRSVAAGDSFAPNFADGRAVQHVLDAIAASDARREWVSV